MDAIIGWWKYLFGYIFSVGGSFFIWYIVGAMWKQLGWDGDPCSDYCNIRPHAWLSRVVGCIDTFLYTSSVLFCYPQFIVFWLAFKVTGRWGYLKDNDCKKDKDIPSRKRDYMMFFIIGNALSVIYGFIGAKYIEWLKCVEWFDCKGIFEASIIPIIVLILTGVLYIWILHYNKYYQPKSKTTD